jgi:uncharacterized membrane protein YbhN (UPF0104 family)
MNRLLRKCWPYLKGVFTLVILIMIGRQFGRDLRNDELWQHSFRPQWLLLSGMLYLLGLAFSFLYWFRLLISLGQQPAFFSALRAHYVGQVGKYVPGKGWALILRSSLIRASNTSMRMAILTSFHEVLTTMAGGLLLAAVVFSYLSQGSLSAIDWAALHEIVMLQAPAVPALDHKLIALLATAMFLAIALPILPTAFNRVVRYLTPRVPDAEEVRLRIGYGTFALGLGLALLCWTFFGASLWAVIYTILPQPPPLSLGTLFELAAYTAFAYVAGFFFIFVPSGLGVREFFLTLFLVPYLQRIAPESSVEANRGLAVLAVLVLRLVWTAAEVLAAGILYLSPFVLTSGQVDASLPQESSL